jgi:ABC-type phosphate transport system permease subunit
VETVWSLVIDVIVTAGIGFALWAADRRHGKYGIMLPVALGVVVGCLAWIIAVAVGTGYLTGLTWVPWIVPMVLGVAVSVGVTKVVERRREKRDLADLTQVLRG